MECVFGWVHIVSEMFVRLWHTVNFLPNIGKKTIELICNFILIAYDFIFNDKGLWEISYYFLSQWQHLPYLFCVILIFFKYSFEIIDFS